MKNLIIAGLILGSMMLANCKKENMDGNALTKAKLVGNWNLILITDQVPIGAPEVQRKYDNSSYDFRKDQSVTINYSGNLKEDEWKLLDEGKLIQILSHTGIYYTIEKLDNDELIFYHDYDIGQGPSRRTFYFKK